MSILTKMTSSLHSKSPHNWSRANSLLLVLAFVLGALLRVRAALGDVSEHPDEFFQYIEPAHWHWTGEGVRAWEYVTGLRNWIFPAYHGAWMVILEKAGVHTGRGQHRFFLIHWAIVGLVLAALARRGTMTMLRQVLRLPKDGDKDAVATIGALAALVVATWPTLVWWAPHVLTELPGMFLVVWAFVLVTEYLEGPPTRTVSTAVKVGLLVGSGIVLRIPNGPVAVLPLFALLVHQRFRAFVIAGFATLPPVALLGLIDRLTWGDWFHSIIAYVDFNFVKGGAANFGTAGVTHYMEVVYGEVGVIGLVTLTILALVVWRRSWFWVLGSFLVVSYLSTQPHKEERFILILWPLLLAPAIAGLGVVVLRLQRTVRSTSIPGHLAISAIAVVLLGLIAKTFVTNRHDMLHDHMEMTCHDTFDVMDGLSYVGQQPDSTGVLSDINWVCNGGTFMVHKNIPLDDFSSLRLSSPLYNYAVMYGDPARVLGAGFLEVARFPRAVVFRRAVKPRPSESELLRKAAASAASSAAPPSLTDGSAPGRPTNDVYGPSNRADDSRETDTRTPLDTE